MSGISDFLDMMPHSLLVRHKTGVNKFNQPEYGSQVSYQARVTFGTSLVRDSKGEVVPASSKAWLATTIPLNTEDEYTFLRDTEPSPATTTRLFPIRIDTISDEDGFHHSKIWFR